MFFRSFVSSFISLFVCSILIDILTRNIVGCITQSPQNAEQTTFLSLSSHKFQYSIYIQYSNIPGSGVVHTFNARFYIHYVKIWLWTHKLKTASTIFIVHTIHTKNVYPKECLLYAHKVAIYFMWDAMVACWFFSCGVVSPHLMWTHFVRGVVDDSISCINTWCDGHNHTIGKKHLKI